MPQDVHFVAIDDSRMAGNWWPFPPPEPGFYHLRQIVSTQGVITGKVKYLHNRRVYTATQGGRLLCMGRRVSRMRPADGWQFQFLRSGDAEWRPVAVQWDLSVREAPVRLGTTDISDQLPVVYSKEEALFAVSQFPTRWPAFVQVHVEFTETRIKK